MNKKFVGLIKEDLDECGYGAHIMRYIINYMHSIYILNHPNLTDKEDIIQALKEFINENY